MKSWAHALVPLNISPYSVGVLMALGALAIPNYANARDLVQNKRDSITQITSLDLRDTPIANFEWPTASTQRNLLKLSCEFDCLV